ncbi:MAG: TonB-dependent receptor [Opitutus sp.]|nr:TonB-dependent receptor [Opitutus sp.]
MSIFPLMCLPSRRLLAAACAFVLVTSAVRAQALATGIISGRVFEGATGKSLQGAVVKVIGTTAVDYTDSDGRYSLSGVPAGTASLEVEYVGLDLFKQTVFVTAGGAAVVDANLKSEVLKMAAFEVAEAARGQALAINQQKTARGIINIVSEETFGAMNDGNIGYALQRLPGISVNEDEDGAPEGANIRGLPSEFNSFQIDGNRIGRGGFNSRNLVADGVANIEVIKAATPDRDGDAIGGIINVVSRSAYQRDGREIRLSGSGTYLGLPEKWGYNTRATYTDIFSVFGREKNLGVSVTASKYVSNRYYTNNDSDFTVLNRANNPTYNLPSDIFLYLQNASTEYNLRTTNSYAVNATIDFRTGPHHSFYFKPLYSHFDLTAERFIARPYLDTRNENTLTGRKTFQVLTQDYAKGTAGTNGSRGEFRFGVDNSETSNDLFSFAAGGRHEANSLTLTYDVFMSFNETRRPRNLVVNVRNVPAAQGYFQWEYNLANRMYPIINVVNGLDPRNPATMNRADISREPEKRTEEALTAKVDLERKFVGERIASALKVGAKFRSNLPKFDQTNFSYTTTATFPYAQIVRSVDRMVHKRQQYVQVDSQKLLALMASSPTLFPTNTYASLRASAVEDFKAEETTTAAYAMGSMQIGRTTILGGVRAEKNTWDAKRKQINQVTLRESPVKNGNDYTNVLPGVHLRQEVRKNLILRASANRSYGRPSLSRLTLGRSEDINGNIAMGNPNLDPTNSDNLDAQIEQYTTQGGLYSAGVFWKKMKGFYYNKIFKFNVLDANDTPVPDPAGTRQFSQWQNALGAENKGLELIAQQKLYFLPKPFNGLGVQLSATFTDSVANYPDRSGEKLPTYGFSHYMFNAAGEYVYGKFRGRISYRLRSTYLEGIDTNKYLDDWFAKREQVDAEVSYRLRKNLRITVSGENLTARPQASYQGTLPYIEDNSIYGWRMTFGAEYTF